MQQPDFYSYLLDNQGTTQPQQQQAPPPPEQNYYNNNNSNVASYPGPSNTSVDKGEPNSSSSLATPSAAVTLKGGTDFRRRKNWSERILVEITGLLHVLSPTGKILYCSESTHELTGYRPHELVGQSLMDFLHVDDMDVFIRDFQMSFHTRSQIKTHYRFRRKDESYVIFEVVGHPKSDIPGQPPQSFFGIAQPVPTKSGALIDAFLELKAENNWLKKRIDELSLKYGKVDTLSSSSSSPQQTIQQQNEHLETESYNTNNNNGAEDWMDTNNSSDLEDFISGYNTKEDNNNNSNGLSMQESSERKDKWKRRVSCICVYLYLLT